MAALAELVSSLPAWVRLGPSLFYPCLVLGTLVPLTWLLEAWLLGPYRRLGADAHWSERARLGFPARARIVSWAFSSTLLVSMTWLIWLGPLTPIAAVLAPAVATAIVGLLSVRDVTRLVAPARPRATPRGLAALLVLGGARLPLLFACVLLASPRFDGVTALALASAIAVVLAWALGLPLFAAERVGLLRRADPELGARVEAAAARVGVSGVVALVADLPSANAFALASPRRLVVTRALLEALPEAALDPALEHELERLAEPRVRRVLGLSSSLLLTLLVFTRPTLALLGPGPAAALVASVFVLASSLRGIARLVGARAVARERARAPYEPGYARVVARIHELEGIPLVLGRGLVGGASAYDRIVASGVDPGFPRPAAPPRALAPLVTCFSLALLSLTGTRVALAWLEHEEGERLDVIHLVLATTGGDPRTFEQLGYARFREGDLEGARIAYDAASALQPDAIEPRALAAHLLMLRGDCEAAVEATWDASVLAERSGGSRARALASRIRRELERCTPSGALEEDEAP